MVRSIVGLSIDFWFSHPFLVSESELISFSYFLAFFQLTCTFQKIEWQIYIKDMALWSSVVKKMLTTYVFPSPFSYRICSVYLLFLSLLLEIMYTMWNWWAVCLSHVLFFLLIYIVFEIQAIKTLNMIKLYGKPIRVNKVRMILYSWYAFP